MSTISRQLPKSNIGRLNAINNLKIAVDVLPPGSYTLPPDIISDLPLVHTNYNNQYLAVEAAEGLALQRISDKNLELQRLLTIDLDFLRVVRLTINRSILFDDGNWQATDKDFYNLDETGGNLPDIYTDEHAINWASIIVNGESARLVVKPSAPAMSNPAAVEVNAQKVVLQNALGQVVAANASLGAARASLDAGSNNIDVFIKRAWDFLEANYSNLDAPAKRNQLRQFGVVYISKGIPNTITFLVKDTNGNILPGTFAVVNQSGLETTANEDGRISISTNLVGQITITLQYPGKQKTEVNFEIPEDAEDQTFDLPDAVMEDNV